MLWGGIRGQRGRPLGWVWMLGCPPSGLTLAICACTPLALRAVTAFCAAVGLSKSTKP